MKVRTPVLLATVTLACLLVGVFASTAAAADLGLGDFASGLTLAEVTEAPQPPGQLVSSPSREGAPTDPSTIRNARRAHRWARVGGWTALGGVVLTGTVFALWSASVDGCEDAGGDGDGGGIVSCDASLRVPAVVGLTAVGVGSLGLSLGSLLAANATDRVSGVGVTRFPGQLSVVFAGGTVGLSALALAGAVTPVAPLITYVASVITGAVQVRHNRRALAEIGGTGRAPRGSRLVIGPWWTAESRGIAVAATF